ncbi:ammonium transporter [Epidermidibacterium keratini]|uniref:Ammonium transporter n=1 Tax=Epidermidibacterium keratini TaxID=1891644 RepID=A0A7L4YMG3_9ACTN|nr:ammonium transporter [Epidermidibacterium keratini]QHB99736.1 ammonium transporter [Epidermidibacterium keratini]
MPPTEYDSGSVAWVLISSALVFLMTPGLAFFYGGMVRAKHVLAMLMQNFTAIAVAGIAWVVVGFSIAFGDGGPLIGDLSYFGLTDYSTPIEWTGLPLLVFVCFQATFAIISLALVTGATADRWKFGAYVAFGVLWVVLIYSVIAHWVWGGGWIAELGALDFAGGTVVHINAGAAGLAMAIVLGKRRGWGKDPMRGHNIPFVMLGAGLLWFGWFGFNAGSALVTNDGNTQLAAVAFLNTLLAGGAALLGWIGYEKLRHGASTTLGAASGIVAGLVAITPAAGFVTPLASIPIGLVAGILCATCLGLKDRFGFDDSLDVVAVHLVGGLWGSLAVGLFATSSVNSLVTDSGLLVGGGAKLLGIQAIAALAALIFSFVGTFIIGKLIGMFMQNRVDVETEITGLDQAMHSETAYEFTSSSQGAHRGGPLAQATASLPGSTAAPVPATTTKEEV